MAGAALGWLGVGGVELARLGEGVELGLEEKPRRVILAAGIRRAERSMLGGGVTLAHGNELRAW